MNTRRPEPDTIPIRFSEIHNRGYVASKLVTGMTCLADRSGSSKVTEAVNIPVLRELWLSESIKKCNIWMHMTAFKTKHPEKN